MALPYAKKRYMMYLFATVVALTLPFIQVNDNHFFLLNFDHKQVHLFFIRFDMQELYLMPFLLIMLFLGIFLMTVMGGRVFCGWACPQTIFRVLYRDFIETKLLKLRKSIKNKQKEPDMSKPENKIKKAIAIGIWSLLALIAASDFSWYFVPPETFFEYLQNPAEHTILFGFVLSVALFLIADIVFIKENFCIYVCPYSRVQSVLYDDETIMAIYDPNRGGQIYNENKEKMVFKKKDLPEGAECTTCESCVTVCPTHIDIRKGLQLECINCLECVDACTVVMGKLGKPSLISWSSVKEVIKREGKTRFFRPKTIGYIAVLAIMVFVLIKLGSEKEHMLLNINRESQLYAIKPHPESENGKRVTNGYIFLFQNTENQDHEYYFEVNNPDIKILRPKHPFKIKAGHKTKKIVVLYTDKMLANDDRKDVTIPIKIRAYAVDEPEKIHVERDAIFVYPRADLVKSEE
ncbi:MAG TPA: cytochrome c oxidase accessory protein CcoG [Campylobacterales bacterium]|nr:cytochrome c oxidase accessory protein CcoG [Campylobacterales bacterium]HIO70474.1 cytochrome c oxidase accessory protein CcoG [Campylobacterales bacterium]